MRLRGSGCRDKQWVLNKCSPPPRESSPSWPWAGEQGHRVSSGSTPPCGVTSAGLRPSPGLSFPPHKSRGGLGQASWGARAAPARLPLPGAARGPCRPGHVRCPRGRHKRQAAAGRAAKLSHPARGPPGCAQQLPPRTSRFPRGPGGGGGAAGPFETPRLPVAGGLARGRPRWRFPPGAAGPRGAQERPAKEAQAAAQINLSQQPGAIRAGSESPAETTQIASLEQGSVRGMGRNAVQSREELALLQWPAGA